MRLSHEAGKLSMFPVSVTLPLALHAKGAKGDEATGEE